MIRRLILIVALFSSILTSSGKDLPNFRLVDKINLQEELFIQGLEFWEDPSGERLLYAGLGLYDDSRILVLDPLSGQVTNITEKNSPLNPIPNYFFGEGISFGPGGLYQLTWKNEECYLRDPVSGEIRQTIPYQGQGWGLAHNPDDQVFYMSDGSSRIYIRDDRSFELIDSFDIGVKLLNELEYAGGYIYANVWMEDYILRIDPRARKVAEVYSFTDLCKSEGAQGDKVLNGIAHLRGNLFYISGKNWSSFYLVEILKTK